MNYKNKKIDTYIRIGDSDVIIPFELPLDEVKAIINLLNDMPINMITYNKSKETLLKAMLKSERKQKLNNINKNDRFN